MLYFFSDLDNTLVYSEKHFIGDDKVVVERLQNNACGYMTRNTFDFFKDDKKIKLIPVTTRTPSQYMRLFASFQELNCEYALTSNGGVLLKNGEADAQWREETLGLIDRSLPALREAFAWMRLTFAELPIRFVDDMMVYTISENADQIAETLKHRFADAGICVCGTKRKVYCLPEALTKGVAVKRFAQRLGIKTWAAAGDSAMDVSMLAEAELSLFPLELAGEVRAPNALIAEPGDILSDFICERLKQIVQ